MESAFSLLPFYMMHRVTALVAFCCFALLVACSGNDPIVVEMVAVDSFAFQPDTLTLPANTSVEISLGNTGSLQHNWVLLTADHDILRASRDDALNGAASPDLAGGESATFQITTPADPGDYLYVCTIPGHAVAGMVGNLTISPP
ncbi:MAG: cupredoxin domain-containing protein [Anaerolineales bacterium]|nr:cupredoxin domain-containing protein [Anaerolineales bacterium]